ncbi:extensin-like domain-containing protein [Xaviernesmea oryzae]|nr:extensin family protein [Xaviernesmea oryzae]SEL36183.1 Uncharacterized conserved protein [Xaviernesmea oryzae]
MRHHFLLLPGLLLLAAAALPENVPLPAEKPSAPQAQPASPPGDKAAPAPADVPKPKDKPPAPQGAAPDAPTPLPAEPEDPAKKTPPDASKEQAPTSPEKTKVQDDATPDASAPPQKEGKAPEPAQPVLTVAPEDPASYAQCLTDLKAIGAQFEERPRIDDGKGCGIDRPISVTAILPGVEVAPAATLRCEAALELARWVKESVQPAAKVAMSEDGALTRLNQASSYVCRLRNNAATGKISEHARGNAIDIASFSFRNGQTIAIQPRDEDGTLTGAFQRAVTATGCLYFETVLDPGSDEAHEDHLHLDVLQRKADYRYCR